MIIKIKTNNVQFAPTFQTVGAAGADIKADLHAPITRVFGQHDIHEDYIEIYPNSRVTIECGFSIEIPNGYEGQIRPRSGKSTKEGMHLPNSVGTIDSDYRGIVKITIHNMHPGNNLIIAHQERIAQLLIKKAYCSDEIQYEVVDSLSETVRGSGGYGHTGK
jgi:dUTP pyrophosphatase